MSNLGFIVEFICLWKLSKFLKFKKTDYMTALKVSLVSTAIGIVFQVINELLSASIDPNLSYLVMQFIGLVVYLVLIKYFYKEDWKKTITIGLIIFLIDIVVVFLLSFLLNILIGPVETTETFIQE
jgi:cell shape-determining protein MreD